LSSFGNQTHAATVSAAAIHPKRPRFVVVMSSSSLASQLRERLMAPALRNVAYIKRRLTVFAVLAIVTFPLYYYVWAFVFPQRYESLTLRLIGSALFVPMLFSRHWPEWMKRLLPYYWYVALLYSLPFFFTYMLLRNNGADVWIGSALVAVFVMILLLDWVTLIVQFVLGSSLAYLAFTLTSDASLPPFARWDYIAIASFAVIAGAVTNYDAERIRIEQERAMLATAGSIAHELRTPLLGIRAGATGLGNYLPTLVESYRLAQAHGLPVEAIRGAHLDQLAGVAERIDAEARQSNAIIEMLLVNARSTGGAARALQTCLISACVEAALRRYPFSDAERVAGFLAERRRVRVSGHRAAHGARPLQLDQERAAPRRPGKKGRNHDAHRGLATPSPDRARQRRRHRAGRAAPHLRALLHRGRQRRRAGHRHRPGLLPRRHDVLRRHDRLHLRARRIFPI
jgi:signal transduction histidine kinase